MLKELENQGLISYANPSAEANAQMEVTALDAIKRVHDKEYVLEVQKKTANSEVCEIPKFLAQCF